MKEYHTTPTNKKYGIDNLPTDDLRMYEEEIKSEEEWRRDTLGTQPHSHNGDTSSIASSSSSGSRMDEDDFDFENSRSTKEKTQLSKVKDDHHTISSE